MKTVFIGFLPPGPGAGPGPALLAAGAASESTMGNHASQARGRPSLPHDSGLHPLAVPGRNWELECQVRGPQSATKQVLDEAPVDDQRSLRLRTPGPGATRCWTKPSAGDSSRSHDAAYYPGSRWPRQAHWHPFQAPASALRVRVGAQSQSQPEAVVAKHWHLLLLILACCAQATWAATACSSGWVLYQDTSGG
jgi:hypothetical protein